MTGAKILIVEDDDQLAGGMHQGLEEMGYEVLCVTTTGEEAVSKAKQLSPHVVLMDIRLPGKVDGVEAARIIWRDVAIPVIFMTGFNDEETIRMIKDPSTFGYLLKPFKLNEVDAAIDIALKRHRAEADLLLSREGFRNILENNMDGILIVDNKKRVLYSNKTAAILLNRSKDQLSHQTFSYELEQGKRREIDISTPDGKRGIAELHSMKLEWGDQICHLVMLRDITESKIMEREFQHAQKMEAVGRLAGGIAHDFNNLLTVITGYAEYALDDKTLPQQAKENFEEIQLAGKRAIQLTSQLLAFSREQIVKPQITDLNQLILRLDKMSRRLIGENIEYVVLPSSNPVYVMVDPGQMEQVLVNLVINARDSMARGGKLEVATDIVVHDGQYTQDHEGLSKGKWVMLSIKDTGEGMSEEVKSHIFEPFFTTKSGGKGTGLGLATCYALIKKFNGSIEVVSETGLGTCFRIYLPYQIGEQGEVQQEVSHQELPVGSETILVVEDERAVRNLAVTILKQQGYKILQAENGDEAIRVIERLEKPEISLLLTDMVMPHMGGMELVERLRQWCPKIRVLLASGYVGNSEAEKKVGEERLDFLSKPFTREGLCIKVRQILDKK